MQKYLSIGEVVKMKGTSHRALRHYDDMGILVPAYVSEETGYRYYSKNQMLILDMIMLCVPLGIPLKQFKDYMLSDGNIDAQKMTEDALNKTLELQKKLEQNLYFLNSVTKHFTEFEENMQQNKTYARNIDNRYFLTMQAPKKFGTFQEYWTNLTALYTIAIKHGFAMSVNQGVCLFDKNGEIEARYYVEIEPTKKTNPHILIIPKSEFLCEFFDDNCIMDAIKIYTKHELFLNGNILILNDVLERKIANKPTPIEAQLML